MLAELRIRDFAIIRQLTLSFDRGLMIFTGETGAGKSIIIDAVELLIGGRAENTMVRSGAEVALLEARFELMPPAKEAVVAILAGEELLEADGAGEIHLSREIRSEGRNVCRVNGRVVPLSLLRQLGDQLVDVHGQSEHLSLLTVRQHLALLDRYAEVKEPLAAYQAVYEQWRQAQSELERLRQRERDAAQRADYLTFQVEEIEVAKLKPGEDEQLEAERTRLANAEKLSALAEGAVAALTEGLQGRPAAGDLLGEAVESVGELAAVDPSLKEVHDESQVLLEQLIDLSRRLRDYRETVEFHPTRLDEVQERLTAIQGLKRKYGGSIEHVLVHAQQARQELDEITHAEERLAELSQLVEDSLLQISRLGADLSQVRRLAAERMAAAVGAELQDLNMPGAEFAVEQEWQQQPAGAPVGDQRVAFGPSGLDQVEFLVAPNPGEGLKPLVKTASGGETSRLMLGLKGVLAKADETPTLIFDEIDQGIGGRVGAVVGHKLSVLAGGHQVLCITHLPQLAAFGDRHYRVEKAVEAGRTETQVRRLEGEARVEELALMLGGTTEPNLESARGLLAEAEIQKKAVELAG